MIGEYYTDLEISDYVDGALEDEVIQVVINCCTTEKIKSEIRAMAESYFLAVDDELFDRIWQEVERR